MLIPPYAKEEEEEAEEEEEEEEGLYLEHIKVY
jgi:hypothetical protein